MKDLTEEESQAIVNFLDWFIEKAWKPLSTGQKIDFAEKCVLPFLKNMMEKEKAKTIKEVR